MQVIKKLFNSFIASLKIAIAARNPFILLKSNIICYGKIVIKGRIYGLRSCHIQIDKNATLVLERDVHISEFVQLRCSHYIFIGKHVRIAPFTLISDSLYSNLGSENPTLMFKSVRIEDCSFLAPFSMIYGDTNLGKSVIIGPFSNVKNKTLSPFTLYTKSNIS